MKPTLELQQLLGGIFYNSFKYITIGLKRLVGMGNIVSETLTKLWGNILKVISFAAIVYFILGVFGPFKLNSLNAYFKVGLVIIVGGLIEFAILDLSSKAIQNIAKTINLYLSGIKEVLKLKADISKLNVEFENLKKEVELLKGADKK
ncbi:hypothetical protein HYU20_02530 [Candidatus Woesearchaeota archaeon]|nr:hypothetical protein [Candidatus Woesearchaeota archaeon]